ncbi:MAG TPA: hypothetical protein VLA04_01065 [Verrucomicrobiae bacterium]|nr:hypothetical protein [Verrucomicrobiae bacterium]
MSFIISLARRYLTDQVEGAMKDAVSPLAPYLRRIALGVTCIVLSILGFSLMLMSAGVAIFLGLAGLPYAEAALWTTLIFAFLGAFILMIGLTFTKKPRR